MSEDIKNEMTLEEWMLLGKNLYGEDLRKWAFICPACKKVSTIQDFLDVGADGNDAYCQCIGRKNGKGIRGITAKGKDNSNGCDWAAYGLFGTLDGGLTVIKPNGERTQVFNFYRKVVDEPCKK